MPVPDSAAVRAVRDFRTSMEALDTQTIESLGMRWLSIENSLQSDIAALAEEMARRTAAGETITQQMIYRAERYQVLRSQLSEQIVRYNAEAVSVIADAQERAAILGIDSAQAAIFASYPSPLSASFDRINVGAVEHLIGISGDGAPLGKLLSKAVGDASGGIVDALINGLGKGEGALQIARAMADGMGLGLDRSVLIARTETNRAYRSASVEQYRASGVVVGFFRLVNKATACVACLALDGEEFDLASEFEDHPNGNCTCVPRIRGMDSPEWEKGPDWFAAQDPAKQLSILGPGRFELYQSGTPLSDFVTHSHSDVWGDAPALRPLRDMIQP